MAIRVGMVSLGCSKNQVDAERMLYKISEKGYHLVADAALSDVVIINTCGFIESAKQEAIETILEFAVLKEEGRIKHIIVTGCLAQRYKEEIATEMPEVDAVLGIGSNETIVEVVERVCSNERVLLFDDKYKLSLTGGRIQTTLSFFSYLKIAEGCSNRCTYCAIPSIRGKYRSAPIEELIAESKELASNGVKELIVIAQDSTRYGEDIYGKPMLPELLRELCKIDELKWIRVLYLYPERITDEILDVIANEEKIVKYIEMPIQHCDGAVLKRLNRPVNEDMLRELIAKIRKKIPNVILRTTFITGFPGETEEQFNSLANFARDIEFDRLGCFAYSAEEGTPAAKMPNQVDDEVKEHRADIIMEEQMMVINNKNATLIGKTFEVVCEGFDRYGECYFGRTYMDAPEIDGKVFFASPNKQLAPGIFVNVRIVDVMDYDLMGEIIE